LSAFFLLALVFSPASNGSAQVTDLRITSNVGLPQPLGLLLAAATSAAFRSVVVDLPRMDEVTLNWRILL